MDYFYAAAFGFASGVMARSLILFGWPTILFPLLIAIVCFILYRLERHSFYAFASAFLIAASIGSARTHLAPQQLPEAFVPYVDTAVSFEGKIVRDPDIRDTNQHVAVRIEEGGEETIVLAYAPLFPELEYGETVIVSGTLLRPEPFDTDGGRVFRYDRFLAKDGIFAVVPRAQVDSMAPPEGLGSWVFGTLYAAKHRFTDGLRAALPEPSSALAEGLLTGGKQGLGEELIDAFTIAGLIQIVVLSGYNVMIVAEAILRSLSFLPKRLALSAAGVGIIAFVVAAGSGSAAVRAGAMACIALFARATGRTYDALRGLLLALVLLALWNPLLLAYDPGFQLSFAATLGLILGTPIVEPWLKFIRNDLLRDVTATTIAAQIAVLPLLLYLTGNLSLVSVLANVLVLPMIPLAMALGFIAGLAGMASAMMAPLIGLPAHLVLAYIVLVGKYAASVPLAHVIIPAFPFGAVIVAYALMWRAAALSGSGLRTRSS